MSLLAKLLRSVALSFLTCTVILVAWGLGTGENAPFLVYLISAVAVNTYDYFIVQRNF